MGGIERLSEAISADLKGRFPGQRKTQREKLALLAAARAGGRALPLAWRVKQTRGAIGFAGQRPALDAVAGRCPQAFGRC